MMEQDTNKAHLLKLLDFLQSRILSNPANQWFAKDLYKILAPASDARISDIYEQCIESILQDQAREFYKDFVIAPIRSQLIADFVKMEHWRRRNNIGEFGLAVYQQIECVINWLGRDNILSEVFRTMMNALCYVDGYNPSVSNRYEKSSYTIAQLLFMHDAPTKSKEILSQQWTFDKFKAINYFVCHKGCLTSFQFNQFVEENNLFGEIYSLRNLNHRGNDLTDKEKDRLKNIETNPSRAFLTITSFLCWFVNSINQGFPLSKELVEFAKSDFSRVKKPNIGPKILGKIDLPHDTRKKPK